MLLTIDVGNTRTALGLFRGRSLEATLREASDRPADIPSLVGFLRGFLERGEGDTGNLEGVVLASVVPALEQAYRQAVDALGMTALVVGAESAGIEVAYPDPSQVGSDRLANAVAASVLHGSPSVVVDLGTATNIEVVDPAGAFAGGVILPGVITAGDTLGSRAARLPRVEFNRPPHMVATDTEGALASGIFHGAVGAVDYLLAGILEEMNFPEGTPVIATGGLAETLGPHLGRVTAIDPDLTLRGLQLIGERSGS